MAGLPGTGAARGTDVVRVARGICSTAFLDIPTRRKCL